MPKIQLDTEMFFSLLGTTLENDELEKLLVVAKAELECEETNASTLKVELNDTNRPDLWSTAGLARQLRSYLTKQVVNYPFYNEAPAPDKTIIVDKKLKDIRPYIVGFEITGKEVDEKLLVELIQSQEKLCENFGQRRATIAMGVYRSDKIQWPVHYSAVDPDSFEFIPLDFFRPLKLRKILTEHSKGREYGHIIEKYECFPLLRDAAGEVLSMPPIINSASLGTVKVGDQRLFLELTGWDLNSLLLAASICACDCKDMGFTITRINTVYEYDTQYTRELPCPYYFQQEMHCSMAEINALLGRAHNEKEVVDALLRMGIQCTETTDSSIRIKVPPYRNDFLHSVDLIEDVMVGTGMENYSPEMPVDFTIGRLTAKEHCKRQVAQTMVGLGFQEMIFPYLGSRKQHIQNIYEESEWQEKEAEFAKISNPISENYMFMRISILPNLLETERVSANSVYPHKIYEIGEVMYRDSSENYGYSTKQVLGFLLADKNAGFTEMNSIIAAILYYHDVDWESQTVYDSRFINDRAAQVVTKKDRKILGIFGEIHPRVLEKFDITMPCAAGELLLNLFL